jgi:hypothetical protein
MLNVLKITVLRGAIYTVERFGPHILEEVITYKVA